MVFTQYLLRAMAKYVSLNSVTYNNLNWEYQIHLELFVFTNKWIPKYNFVSHLDLG